MSGNWRTLVVLFATIGLSAAAFGGERGGGGRGGAGGGPGAGRGGEWFQRRIDQQVEEWVEKLELNEDQAEEIRLIYDNSYEEMRQAMQAGGRRAMQGARNRMQQSQQMIEEKIVPLLQPEQLKLYIDELASRSQQAVRDRIPALRQALGLNDEDAWAAFEEQMNLLLDLKGQLEARLKIAKGELRALTEETRDTTKAVEEKIEEMKTIRKEVAGEIEQVRVELRASLTQDQWVKLILDEFVE